MTRVAPFGLLQPVFAIVAGVIFLHEPLTAALVTGAVACIVGVAITQRQSLSWRSRAVAAPVSAGRAVT
ncbi:MAG: protein of unknown function transrane [Microvirga sp.]|nr:protein of unknown function transrane [Microvirga sp.]